MSPTKSRWAVVRWTAVFRMEGYQVTHTCCCWGMLLSARRIAFLRLPTFGAKCVEYQMPQHKTMRRFSLNPANIRNVRAAIFLCILFGGLYGLAWITNYVGMWFFWVSVIVLVGVYSSHNEKQEKIRRKRLGIATNHKMQHRRKQKL